MNCGHTIREDYHRHSLNKWSISVSHKIKDCRKAKVTFKPNTPCIPIPSTIDQSERLTMKQNLMYWPKALHETSLFPCDPHASVFPFIGQCPLTSQCPLRTIVFGFYFKSNHSNHKYHNIIKFNHGICCETIVREKNAFYYNYTMNHFQNKGRLSN